MLQTSTLQLFPLKTLLLARVGHFWVSRVGSEDFRLERPGLFHVALPNCQVVSSGRLDITVAGKPLHDMDWQDLCPVPDT